jgi:hypothetical protein
MKETIKGVPRPIIVKFTRHHKMNDHEYKSLSEIIKKNKEKNGDNQLYAETYCKGKVIINDKSFYKEEKKSSNEKNAEENIKSKIWSYLI